MKLQMYNWVPSSDEISGTATNSYRLPSSSTRRLMCDISGPPEWIKCHESKILEVDLLTLAKGSSLRNRTKNPAVKCKCFNERSVERATVLYLFLCFVFSFSRESSGPSSYLSLIKLLRPARTVLPSHKSARLISQREVLASSTNKTPIQGGYDNSVWSNFGFCSCCLSIFH